jgi:hypothetical protein
LESLRNYQRMTVIFPTMFVWRFSGETITDAPNVDGITTKQRRLIRVIFLNYITKSTMQSVERTRKKT